MESFLQSLLTILLILLNKTSTSTVRGLQSIFDSKNEFLGIGPETILWLSTLWSLKSTMKRTNKIIKMKKVVFPTLAKAMVYLYSIASILKELMSIIIFFTPCLGLFHLLNHLKFEKIPFKGSLKKNKKVWNFQTLNFIRKNNFSMAHFSIHKCQN